MVLIFIMFILGIPSIYSSVSTYRAAISFKINLRKEMKLMKTVT